MSKSPTTVSSRSRFSPYKRTITYSKRDKARATTPSRLPQTRSLPNTPNRQTPHASSSGNRMAEDVIDLTNDNSDSDSDICSLNATTPRQGSASLSRTMPKDDIDLSDGDSDTVLLPFTILEQADIGKRLADALEELDATKKKAEKYEA
ncbi:hypothetical protein BT96DRAFT_951747, partial [Gymnopus androsaceus JB14]